MIDRSLFTANANFCFSDQALKDFNRASARSALDNWFEELKARSRK